jgi:hypothetical protein
MKTVEWSPEYRPLKSTVLPNLLIATVIVAGALTACGKSPTAPPQNSPPTAHRRSAGPARSRSWRRPPIPMATRFAIRGRDAPAGDPREPPARSSGRVLSLHQ